MRKTGLVTKTVACIMICCLLSGCDASPAKEAAVSKPAVNETEESPKISSPKKPEKPDENDKEAEEKATGGKSLAQRMAGKYSYHSADDEGNDEFLIMDVVPFGDNLYAFCGQAMPGDYQKLSAYTFWATEFVPYDADEVKSSDKDTLAVNELCFSIMSNAGKYWDAGHKGTITFTDDGLVFEGFDHDGFLVPEGDDSRLFLKDERVEDAFGYLNSDKGDEELEGLWILDRKDADLYIRFTGANMYLYSKKPDSEVFYAAGGCDFSDGEFSCTVSRIEAGGMPIELNCVYKTDGDTLMLRTECPDLQDEIPANGKFKRVKDGDAHVTTMDEIEFDTGSFGMYAEDLNLEQLSSQDYYGVFVSSAKDRDKCTPTIDKLEAAGFEGSFSVYTPDFSGLNPEPYHVVTTGLYTSESEAEKILSEVKAAGFADAYMKYAGSYQGDRYWYTAVNGEDGIEMLKDGILLRGVSVDIPYFAEGESVTADLIVTEDTVFDKTADLQFFGNSEKGDTPYEWISRNYQLMHDDIDQYLMYGPALSGIFEVSLDNNKITAYYGSYWWD